MPGATRIIAIRHGETAWNVDGRIQGQLDIPLNVTGRWQAHRMALALADEPFAALYCSDLARARETGDALAAKVGLPLQFDTGLRERHFGMFQGKVFSEIEAGWPEAARRWRVRDPAFVPEGGESLIDFSARCVDAVRRHAEAHPGETIAIVAHGGVMDCLYREATHLALDSPRTWQLRNASINRLLYTDSGFTLVGWSDTGHLEGTARDEASEP